MSFLLSLFGLGEVKAPEPDRKAALAVGPLESLDGSPVATWLAGGRECKGALPLAGAQLDAAIYSSRGRGYANYNEDAAGLFKSEKGRVFAFVLDQAGGLGGEVRGQGSERASQVIFEAFKKVLGQPKDTNPLPELERAFGDAHRALIERGQGEVTTAVAAVVTSTAAHLMNSGDSAALHFDAKGKRKQQTELHVLEGTHQGYLTHALGLSPEGANPEDYLWTLEPGDWLVLATDGLLDAELDEATFARLLSQASSAEQAVNRIASLVLRRMGTMRAKPDNLTMVVLRVPPRD